MNGTDHGVPTASPPPDPLLQANGLPNPPHPSSVNVDEAPVTKFTFQAKIDINRNRSETKPLLLNARLIEVLIQHQRVDPTFHFLPTEKGFNSGAIMMASDIPNTEEKIKHCVVKNMHDVDHHNNHKSYTVVFFIKVASSMTLGMMKHDHVLYEWLQKSKLWIKAFRFETTYDVVNTGLICHMNGSLHNRDRINNETIQTALKQHYPHLEVKLVPETIKHGLDRKKRINTQVVSLQADRNHLNEVR
jgi:hypothetical protein